MKLQLKKIMGEGEEIECSVGKLVCKCLNTQLQLFLIIYEHVSVTSTVGAF